MKKLKSIFLTLAMILSTILLYSGNSFAESEGFDVTIQNSLNKQHKIEAYQILKGDVATVNGKRVLSNAGWGSGVNSTSIKALYPTVDDAITYLTQNNGANAKEFANKVSNHLTSTKTETTIPANGSATMKLTPGYYLIKDVDGTQGGQQGAYTEYMLKVVGPVSSSLKVDVPTVEKKVKDINESTDADFGDWKDSADHGIGKEIPYKLTGTLPSNYEEYETYSYKFVDTMSKGLTIDESSIKVTAKTGNGEFDITSKAQRSVVKNPVDGSTTLTLAYTNLKEVNPNISKSSEIVVEYNATLNENAVIGSKGNPNEVYLEYSNNPNAGGTGDKGQTPKDKNIVFTYELDVNKVNENKQPLEGAEFTLFKKMQDGTQKKIEVIKVSGTKFSFKGLDDGKYILKETKTPSGYNTIKDQEFEITAEHSEGDNPALIKLDVTGNSVLEFASDKGNGILSTDIVNKKGIELPETGGMGTYFIYGVGIAMLSIAGAVFVAKKRKECK